MYKIDFIDLLKLKMVLRFLKLEVNIRKMIKKKLFFMDVKAMNILYYILGKSEFDRKCNELTLLIS